MDKENKSHPDQTKLPPQATVQAPPDTVSLEDVERRLQIVEKTESSMTELLKWAFIAFTVTVSIVAVYNWWSVKTDYEKDKEYMRQQAYIFAKQSDLAQKELTHANNKKMQELKYEMETSFVTASNIMQKSLDVIQYNNDVKWTNASVAISNTMRLTAMVLTNILYNVSASIHAEVSSELTNDDVAINKILVQIQERAHQETAEAMGMAAMVQGKTQLAEYESHTKQLNGLSTLRKSW